MYYRFYIFLSKLVILSYFIKYRSRSIKWLFPVWSRSNLGRHPPAEAQMLWSVYRRGRQKTTLEKLETSLGLVVNAQFLWSHGNVINHTGSVLPKDGVKTGWSPKATASSLAICLAQSTGRFKGDPLLATTGWIRDLSPAPMAQCLQAQTEGPDSRDTAGRPALPSHCCDSRGRRQRQGDKRTDMSAGYWVYMPRHTFVCMAGPRPWGWHRFPSTIRCCMVSNGKLDGSQETFGAFSSQMRASRLLFCAPERPQPEAELKARARMLWVSWEMSPHQRYPCPSLWNL